MSDDPNKYPQERPPLDYEVAMSEKYYNYQSDCFIGYDKELDFSTIFIDKEQLLDLDFESIKAVINYLSEVHGKQPYTDKEIHDIIEKLISPDHDN